MNKVAKHNPSTGGRESASLAGDPAGLITRMSETWAGWNEEVTRFAGTRLQRDIEFWSSLVAAKDLGEVVKAQQAWLATTSADYAKEWPKIFQLAIPAGTSERDLRRGH